MEPQDSVDISEDVKAMQLLVQRAPAIVTAVLAAGLTIALLGNRIGGLGIIELAGWIYLMAATALIFFCWVQFPRKNLEILARWFDKRHKESYNPQLEQLSAIAIASIVGALLVTAFWPLYYSIVFILYALVYYIGVRHLNKNVRFGLEHTRKTRGWVGTTKTDTQADEYDAAYTLIHDYHFRHNHLLRILILLAIAVAGFILALLERLEFFRAGDTVAAFLMATGLIVMEIQISSWRTTYYREEALIRSRMQHRKGRETVQPHQ